MKLLKCAFLDTNRVFTLIGDGRKIFGVNGCLGAPMWKSASFLA